jgi:hypothetical protein
MLDTAADVAFKMAAVDSYDSRYPNKLIYPDRKWEVVFLGGSPVFRKDSYLDFDALINFFHKAYSTSAAMVLAMPAKGSHAANYWSVVLYDADTRSLLDNGQPFPSIASNSNLKPNADGSSDIWFGPTAPRDANANWLKAVPGRGYFVGMRLYAPTEAFFAKQWKLDDIVKAN